MPLEHNVGWTYGEKQTKVEWKMRKMGFIKTKMPVTYVRDTKYSFRLIVDSEDEIIRKSWDMIKQAAVEAAAVAGIASLISSPAAAWPTFVAHLKSRIGATIWAVLQSSVRYSIEKEHCHWSKV